MARRRRSLDELPGGVGFATCHLPPATCHLPSPPMTRSHRTAGALAPRPRHRCDDAAVLGEKALSPWHCGHVGSASFRKPPNSSSRKVDQMIIADCPAKYDSLVGCGRTSSENPLPKLPRLKRPSNRWPVWSARRSGPACSSAIRSPSPSRSGPQSTAWCRCSWLDVPRTTSRKQARSSRRQLRLQSVARLPGLLRSQNDSVPDKFQQMCVPSRVLNRSLLRFCGVRLSGNHPKHSLVR